jgi:tetratricopeptide (TPR) repeat protein
MRRALAVAAWLLLMPVAWANPPTYTPEDYKKAAATCMRGRHYECAQKNWEYVLGMRPTDSNAMANLGIVMNLRENHAGAITQFERAIDLGEGTYDLFAYYADSLEKSGRIDEAIDWSYRALAVVPRLVDVRGKLAKLLVVRKRHYEALSLLSAYDQTYPQQAGAPGYFEGQRIAIETALARQSAAAPTQTAAPALRLPRFESHYYAPVTLGESRPEPFVIDTGATLLTLSDEWLDRSKVPHKVLDAKVPMKTADGRRTTGRTLLLPSVRVGPHELKDVQAFTCKGCVFLLGQSALNRFDLKSSKVQGIEFLTLSLRR